MRSIEQLTQEVLSLPNTSRAHLAKKLVESLEFDTGSNVPSAGEKDGTKPRNEIRDASVQPISGEEALAQVLHRLISSNEQT
jgi:hypothetical protein